jgi:hypothetical protein
MGFLRSVWAFQHGLKPIFSATNRLILACHVSAFSPGKRRLSMKEQIHEDHVSQVLSTLDSLIDHEYATDSFASISEPSDGSEEAVSTWLSVAVALNTDWRGCSWKSANTCCCKHRLPHLSEFRRSRLPRRMACKHTPHPPTNTLWSTSTQQTTWLHLARFHLARLTPLPRVALRPC